MGISLADAKVLVHTWFSAGISQADVAAKVSDLNLDGDLESLLNFIHEQADRGKVGTDYTFTDRGNGARFGDMFRGRVFYCPERKLWAVYNGRYWQWDTGTIRVMRLAKEVPKAIYRRPQGNRMITGARLLLSMPDEQKTTSALKPY